METEQKLAKLRQFMSQNDIPAVLAAVADGRIAESDIDAHVLRILRYKQAQGWIE